MRSVGLASVSNVLDQTFLIFLSQHASGLVTVPGFQPVRPLPAVQFHVERINIEHSVPMYAPELIGTVSSLNQPSDNLLHHCYAHLYLKVRMETLLVATGVSRMIWTRGHPGCRRATATDPGTTLEMWSRDSWLHQCNALTAEIFIDNKHKT